MDIEHVLAHWQSGVQSGQRAIEELARQKGGENVGAIFSDSPNGIVSALSRTIDRIRNSPEEPSSPEEQPRSVIAILGELAFTMAMEQSLKERADALVVEARNNGATWAEIGEYFGVTAQSAYQRFTPRGREKHREYQRKRRESPTTN